MFKPLTLVKRILRSWFVPHEEGATLAEYGLLLALIAIVCLGVIRLLGTRISSLYATISSSI
jgi:pilus assembly protein Flp/PilA